MSIHIGNALYSTGMILLAFVTAIVLTKTISKYIKSKEEAENEG
jgi:hypothetical protein